MLVAARVRCAVVRVCGVVVASLRLLFSILGLRGNLRMFRGLRVQHVSVLVFGFVVLLLWGFRQRATSS